MAKVTGTIRINANPGSSGAVGHFEVVFVPYAAGSTEAGKGE